MRSRLRSPTCLAHPVAARWLAALVLGIGVLPARDVLAQQASTVSSPAAGTPTRKALLDAVRRHLKTTAMFKVDHIAVSGPYAFVRAGEVVQDGENLQETDLFIETLLERSNGRWRVVHLWNLSEEGEKSAHDAFLARVRRVIRDKSLPTAMLPDDLRSNPGA